MPNGILTHTIIPKNPERKRFSKRHYLMACECPTCDTIFLIEFPNKYIYENTGMCRMPCPHCNVVLDWLNYKIFGFQYKWIRFWRGLHRKGDAYARD